MKFSESFLIIITTLIFFYFFFLFIYFSSKAKSSIEAIRYITAILIPFVSLGFILHLMTDQNVADITFLISSINWIFRFIIGIVIGIVLAEFGIRALRCYEHVLVSIYLLFASSVCAFIIYLLSKGALRSLDYSFFGLILAVGFWFIFRQ